ncbi:hypothetical protein Taro_053284 [Colocasia esculenta]|uniref:Aminotransferase-like plant mobile domain-containing protein n=1 Tax=Colocasia esculenta TaxID=4460 RepID=A0A843XLR1_COLES|nr:hypothetical protein [Colocasia esculenta]
MDAKPVNDHTWPSTPNQLQQDQTCSKPARTTHPNHTGLSMATTTNTHMIHKDPKNTQRYTNAFVLPWGHMIPSLEDVSRITGLRVYGHPVSGYTYPCYRELARRLLDLTVEQRSSVLSRVELQESLGLFQTGKRVAETVDEQLQRLMRGCKEALADEPGAQADLDLRRFLIFFLGRLLFATRGDLVHCRFLPLLENVVQGAAFLAHQFDSLCSSDRQTAINGLGLPLPPWPEEGDLGATGSRAPSRHWVPCRDTHPLGDQLASLQDAIDLYPQLDVVWQPYLEEGSEGQPWLEPARPYFGRTVWIHALNLVLPLHLYLTQRSLGLRQSAVWSNAVSNDAYLQAFALKYGAKVYKGARRQVDVAGEIASLQALLHSAVQDREVAQREADQLIENLTSVACVACGARQAECSQSDLEDRLADAVRRAEDAQAELVERVAELRTATDRATHLQKEVDRVAAERDQLRTQTDEMADERARLCTQGPAVDQAELDRLRSKLLAQ